MTIGLKPQQPTVAVQGALEPWQQRVVEEHAELGKKVGKLAAYVWSSQFEQVPPEQRELLQEQLGVMQKYLSILERRMEAWKLPTPAPQPEDPPQDDQSVDTVVTNNGDGTVSDVVVDETVS